MERKSHKISHVSKVHYAANSLESQIALKSAQRSAAAHSPKSNSHYNSHSLSVQHAATNATASNPAKAVNNSHNSHNISPNTIVTGISATAGTNSVAGSLTHGSSTAKNITNSSSIQQSANKTANTNSTVAASEQPAGKAVVARNKNEEAIRDLRERIPDIENIFDIHSRIGNGTFSTVLLGTLKKERDLPDSMKRKFAIKHHIPTSHPDRIMKELKCMAKIGGSNNVVGINCCIRNDESVAFIMPYLPHDRFHDFFNKMDLQEVQNYMKSLLIALRHVHKFNVIHRDVKPSNFLYNRRKRQFLLVDFGLAQQVPNSSQYCGSSSNSLCGMSGIPQLGAGAAPAIAEGKRPREGDDSGNSSTAGVRATGGCDVIGGGSTEAAAKRRCCGGETSAGATVANSTIHARFSNSCSIVGGSPFKMPLKQLNEINNPVLGKNGGTAAAGNGEAANASNNAAANNSSAANNALASPGNRNNSGIYDITLQRQVKSAALLSNSKLHQKLKHHQGSGRSSLAASNAAANASSLNMNAEVNASGASLAKYNTNRNLSNVNGTKCHCFGNPQVCNICLVKKEVHASRAGTPGYRPPEVLLKYPDQTTAVDIWASGVIFLSVLSSVYPFFKAPSDYVALAEMVTIFGDKVIRKTANQLDRLVTLSQKTKPLDLRKLCVRFRNRAKFSSPELLKKYQRVDGSCEVCKNCDQFFFNCLCTDSTYNTEPLDNDDLFPPTAYDLLYKLLEVNPHKRISAEEALKHPFFHDQGKICSTANNNNNITSNNNNNNTVMSNNNSNAVGIAAAACGGEPVVEKKKACL